VLKLRPVAIQHTSQHPREHTTHVALIGTEHYSRHIVNQPPHDSIATQGPQTSKLLVMSSTLIALSLLYITYQDKIGCFYLYCTK